PCRLGVVHDRRAGRTGARPRRRDIDRHATGMAVPGQLGEVLRGRNVDAHEATVCQTREPRYPAAMRIARFTTGGDPRYALVDGEPGSEQLVVIAGDPIYTPVQQTGETVPLDRDDVRLLAPVIPRSKVIGVGRNYAAHAAEFGHQVPTEPLLFLKPNTAAGGPDDPIVLPAYSREVHHEAELAVVIGKVTKDVSVDRA